MVGHSLEDLTDDKIYYELDQIDQNHEALEDHLFRVTYKRDKESYSRINYDLSSSYFVGIKCSLSRCGHSRDDKPRNKQVLLAIMVNDRGYPFKWDVYPGNTVEVKTLMTPVDYAARALVHLSLRRESYGRVFHLANASPPSSAQLVDFIRSFGYRLKTMPYDPWRIEALRNMEADPKNALKPYMPLFAGADGQGKVAVMNFDNTRTRKALEPEGIVCPGADETLVHRYLNYLLESGFLEKPPEG